MIDVLCATMGEIIPKGLQNIPFPYEYHEDRSAGWAQAANALLDIADKNGRDCVFLDDDVEILPSTFDSFPRWREHADILGFSLLGPGALAHGIQSSGTMLIPQHDTVWIQGLDQHIGALLLPTYLAHTGTCLVYIKHAVLKAGVRFPEWEGGGMHYEDLAFCLDAWLKGFRCLRLPSVGIHHGAENGAGITKGNDPRFQERRAINEAHMRQWIVEHEVTQAVMAKRIPLGYRAAWEWK